MITTSARTRDSLDLLAAAWSPSAINQSSFTSGIDITSATVRLSGAGVWTESDVDRYLKCHKPIVDEARRRFGTLKVFCDLRGWIVDRPTSATQFLPANNQIYLPNDRIVAVVSSSICKPHTRSAFSTSIPETFLSMRAAEMWLQAHSVPEMQIDRSNA
jgi:hypothetical protein